MDYITLFAGLFILYSIVPVTPIYFLFIEFQLNCVMQLSVFEVLLYILC